jgi:hypothetical protein
LLKSITILEIKKDERVYQFHMPPQSTLGELHDVLYEMRSMVAEKIQEILKVEQNKAKDI